MPYKLEGNDVMHKVNGRWVIKQHTATHANAKRAMRLLNAIEHGYYPGRYKSR